MVEKHDCNNGDCEHEEGIVTLVDEEGKEHNFAFIDAIEVEGQEYAILAPITEDEEEGEEAIILRIEKDENGDDLLTDIENDEEWEKVADAWQEMIEEEE